MSSKVSGNVKISASNREEQMPAVVSFTSIEKESGTEKQVHGKNINGGVGTSYSARSHSQGRSKNNVTPEHLVVEMSTLSMSNRDSTDSTKTPDALSKALSKKGGTKGEGGGYKAKEGRNWLRQLFYGDIDETTRKARERSESMTQMLIKSEKMYQGKRK